MEALNPRLYRIVESSKSSLRAARLYWGTVFKSIPKGQTRLISKTEVATLFGVSKQTIERWVKDGKLPQPRRSLFSARWDYEELARLVKFRSNRQ